MAEAAAVAGAAHGSKSELPWLAIPWGRDKGSCDQRATPNQGVLWPLSVGWALKKQQKLGLIPLSWIGGHKTQVWKGLRGWLRWLWETSRVGARPPWGDLGGSIQRLFSEFSRYLESSVKGFEKRNQPTSWPYLAPWASWSPVCALFKERWSWRHGQMCGFMTY